MAIKANPVIVRDGLVLALDAANLRSFDSYENLVLQSSQVGVTPTYVQNASVIVGLNTTATTAPNELNEATSIDNNGNTATNYVYSGAPSGLTTNTTYTYSIHIKQGTKPDFQITIDENGFGGKRYYSTFTYSTETLASGITGAANDGVLVGSSVNKLTNGWYRLITTFTTSTTSVSSFIDMISRFGNTSGSNYVWGRQLEKGTTVSTYYPTTSSAKNRGTTLTDLSGLSNTGTLTNGPTYSSANGGSIVFDGTDDYVTLTNNVNTRFYHDQPWTISLVYKIVSYVNTYPGLIVLGSSSSSGVLIFYAVEGLVYWKHNNVQTSFTNSDIGTIKHITITYGGSGNVLVYVNGSGGTNVGTMASTDTSSSLLLGSGDQKGNVQIYSFLKYNRALTAAEISQNYYATKSRYGL